MHLVTELPRASIPGNLDTFFCLTPKVCLVFRTTLFRCYIVCMNLGRKRRRSGGITIVPAVFWCFVLVIVTGCASDSTTSLGEKSLLNPV